MGSQRLVTLGVVLLLMGIQFRVVDTFVLNSQASQFVEKRLQRRSTANLYTTQNTSLSGFDPFGSSWDSDLPSLSTPQKSFSPPHWIGLSLISIGAVLILTNPCYRS